MKKKHKLKQIRSIDLNDDTELFFNQTDTTITPKNATSISAVYSAISAISDTISTLPLNLYHKFDDKREIAYEHYLEKLIKFSPNEYFTQTTFIEAIVKSMLVYGNAFIYPIKQRNNQIVRLELLDPTNITIFSYEKTPFYNYTSKDASLRLELNELINIPYFSFDGLNGLSPISACKATLELSKVVENQGIKFYKNGAFPSGVLELPNELSDEAYLRLSKSWHRAYSGNNLYKTAILESGAKYNPIAIANKDAQYVELKQFQISDIARIFNIPAHKIGDLTHATFSNIEQQELNYAIQTIRPLITKIESFLNKGLLLENEREEYYFKFNLSAMLRGDVKSRFESYMLGRNMGVYSVNEIRRLEELNPIEGGDVYDKPLNSNLKIQGEK